MPARVLTRHHDAFLRSLGAKRPETQGTYERALREFLRWCRKDRLFRFRERDVLRYKRHLRRRRLSDVSIATYLTALRRFCQYLMDAGVLAHNPAKKVGGGKRPVLHRRDVLSETEVRSLIGAIGREDERGRRDYAVVRLMLDCALSEIEVVRADVADLVTSDGTATLRVQGKGRVEKDQMVTVPADLVDSITGYLQGRGEIRAGDPLFTSAGNRTRGLRMTTRGIRDRVNFYLRRAGIKRGGERKVSPYSLRHTAAVMMAERGANAGEIRQRMRLGSDATAMLYLTQKHQK